MADMSYMQISWPAVKLHSLDHSHYRPSYSPLDNPDRYDDFNRYAGAWLGAV